METSPPFSRKCVGVRNINLFLQSIIGGAWVKCMFYPEIDCPSYEAQKELGYEPNPKEIRERACPQCPNGPNMFKENRGALRKNVPSLGNYIF